VTAFSSGRLRWRVDIHVRRSPKLFDGESADRIHSVLREVYGIDRGHSPYAPITPISHVAGEGPGADEVVLKHVQSE
jgi:hypothetical protein